MKGMTKDIISLLENTQRLAVINGKPMPQVVSCVMTASETQIMTTSIVRDGLSGVATFVGHGDEIGSGTVIIPSISKVLSALKTHRGPVSLTQDEDKLRIKSKGKSTTLAASPDALAFPHTHKTVTEWHGESLERMEAVSSDGYILRDGTKVPYFATFTVESSKLKDAILSGNINGQKVAKYTLKMKDDSFSVAVGNDLYGFVETFVGDGYVSPDFEFEIEGGLENISYETLIELKLLDFREKSQGFCLVIESGSSVLFQRGLW